jgi:hypothetical protein
MVEGANSDWQINNRVWAWVICFFALSAIKSIRSGSWKETSKPSFGTVASIGIILAGYLTTISVLSSLGWWRNAFLDEAIFWCWTSCFFTRTKLIPNIRHGADVSLRQCLKDEFGLLLLYQFFFCYCVLPFPIELLLFLTLLLLMLPFIAEASMEFKLKGTFSPDGCVAIVYLLAALAYFYFQRTFFGLWSFRSWEEFFFVPILVLGNILTIYTVVMLTLYRRVYRKMAYVIQDDNQRRQHGWWLWINCHMNYWKLQGAYKANAVDLAETQSVAAMDALIKEGVNRKLDGFAVWKELR